jgi:hypothetical protein
VFLFPQGDHFGTRVRYRSARCATRGLQWLCSSSGRISMEGETLLGPRFHAPARRNTPLSSKPGASGPGAASRSRWQPTRGVCGQHSQLSPLPAARAMSMEWQRDRETSPGERPAASASSGLHSSAATRDWSRRAYRRACMQLVRTQRIEVSRPPPAIVSPGLANVIPSRAQRAHSRLSWQERLARNARASPCGQVTIRLFGVPEHFAIALGLAAV